MSRSSSSRLSLSSDAKYQAYRSFSLNQAYWRLSVNLDTESRYSTAIWGVRWLRNCFTWFCRAWSKILLLSWH